MLLRALIPAVLAVILYAAWIATVDQGAWGYIVGGVGWDYLRRRSANRSANPS